MSVFLCECAAVLPTGDCGWFGVHAGFDGELWMDGRAEFPAARSAGATASAHRPLGGEDEGHCYADVHRKPAQGTHRLLTCE